MTDVLTSIDELCAYPTRTRGLVMTMGALHEGHLSLIDLARQQVGADGQVLVSIFVNPLQFGAGEDFSRYPRTWDADLAACRDRGVDAVFAPAASDILGGDGDMAVTVDPGPLAALYEGVARPGHFRGVLTIVLKVLNLIRPQYAVFGEKDYQQLVLIRRMVRDLDVPVTVVPGPVVREPDGLAMSSRNVYLDGADRSRALALHRGLLAGAALADQGAPQAAITDAVERELGDDDIVADYVALTGPDLELFPTAGDGRLLVAASVGGVRLLDNCGVRT